MVPPSLFPLVILCWLVQVCYGCYWFLVENQYNNNIWYRDYYRHSVAAAAATALRENFLRLFLRMKNTVLQICTSIRNRILIIMTEVRVEVVFVVVFYQEKYSCRSSVYVRFPCWFGHHQSRSRRWNSHSPFWKSAIDRKEKGRMAYPNQKFMVVLPLHSSSFHRYCWTISLPFQHYKSLALLATTTTTTATTAATAVAVATTVIL